MNKKIGFLIILSIMLIGIKVDAASYSMTLNTASQEVEKDSVVDIYVTLDNINGITDGINACWFNLNYDSSKITINSITGENNWTVTKGTNIVVDGNSVTTKNNIAKINAKILDNSAITIKDIECSDGNNDISASTNTLSFSTKQVQQDNVVNNNISNNNNGSNDNYNSSATVEPSETGVKELTIAFLLLAILSLIIKKIVSKKDLFKKL